MNPFDKFTSLVPYMIRAYYDWMDDNELTPFIHVDTSVEGVSVPSGSVDENGWIVLNIGANATGDFHIGETEMTFKSRFQGQIHEIVVPFESIFLLRDRNGEVQFLMRDPSSMQASEDDHEEAVDETTQEPELQSAEVEQGEEVKPDAPEPNRPTIRVV